VCVGLECVDNKIHIFCVSSKTVCIGRLPVQVCVVCVLQGAKWYNNSFRRASIEFSYAPTLYYQRMKMFPVASLGSLDPVKGFFVFFFLFKHAFFNRNAARRASRVGDGVKLAGSGSNSRVGVKLVVSESDSSSDSFSSSSSRMSTSSFVSPSSPLTLACCRSFCCSFSA
jgi:hypothetical protein